ncbi:hypothetical protein TWF281_011944 [Arthrobotrys megalospora]
MEDLDTINRTMELGDQATDASQLGGVRSLSGKKGQNGLTTAPFAEYSSKRDRQMFPFTNSPSKRTKLSGLFNGRRNQDLVMAKDPDSGETGLYRSAAQLSDVDKGLLRKNYLGDSGKANSLSGKMRLVSGVDAVTEATAEKLSISDRREGPDSRDGLTAVGRGTRLSRTPPPFSVEFDDPAESPLPPTIKERHASPDTIKRGLEEIYSSGKRKVHHERIEHRSTPDWSPTRKPRSNASRDTTDHYFPAASTGIKDKVYRTFLEHRDALQREIGLLEDELAVEKRKALVNKGSKASTLTPDHVSAFIMQCLNINDEEITRNIAVVQGIEEAELDPRNKPQRGKISSQHGMKDFCALTFTDYNATALIPNSDSINQRFLQGYSHENLLHFKTTMEILPTAGPVVHHLKIECSDWARTELGQALSKFSMEQNISLALYSISSYATLARRRAETWVMLQSRFSKFIPVAIYSEANLKVPLPKVSEDRPKIGRRLLVANLPRRKLTFRGRNALSNTQTSTEAEVSLSWHIDIKATGESYSDVSANIKLLPGDADEIRVTQQMSNLFKALVGEYGFMEGASRLLETIFGGV